MDDKPVVVTAAVIERDGRFLIARRGPGQALAGFWEFPGGKLEPGEDSQVCLQRELMEEFGVEVRVGELLTTTVHRYDHITIELQSFRSELVRGELRPRDHDEIKWVRPEEMGQYELAPADLPTVSLLQKVELESD